ncbi:MAG: NAD-dependent epimerase/dehydratase family protein [Bacteroidia bacterium]
MILVTGGTGLVGSHLLFELCKSGNKIKVLKRSSSNITNVRKVFAYYSAEPDTLLNNITWVDADLLDVYSLIDAMEEVTQIYHCAAMVSFDSKDEEKIMQINVEGTANIVNAALTKGIKKICHVSSIATIGRSEHLSLLNEELFWKYSPSQSNYSISKYGAERELWRASEEGLDVVIVNPSLIIGPGNWTQSSSNLFEKGYNGMRYYTEGSNGYIDVRDVAILMIRLMNSEIKNERFILNSENIAYRTFFDMLHKQFGKPLSSVKIGKLISAIAWRVEKVKSFFLNSRPLITRETAISAHSKSSFSNEKIKKVFPDFNFISIEQSVKDTCALYLNDHKLN